MTKAIKIIDFNFFGKETGSNEWNSKVVYQKNGKTYVAQLFMESFRREFFAPRTQEKGHKLLAGVLDAITIHTFN